MCNHNPSTNLEVTKSRVHALQPNNSYQETDTSWLPQLLSCNYQIITFPNLIFLGLLQNVTQINRLQSIADTVSGHIKLSLTLMDF